MWFSVISLSVSAEIYWGSFMCPNIFLCLSLCLFSSLCVFLYLTRSGILLYLYIVLFIYIHSVQLLSCVWLFGTPWTAARQASLSVTNSPTLPKLMSIELVMPPSHLILCRPLLRLPSIFPTIRCFSNESCQLFSSGGQSIRVSAWALVLPMNTQDWSPLGWTGWISLQSKGFSRVFSNTTVQKHQFSCAQRSL